MSNIKTKTNNKLERAKAKDQEKRRKAKAVLKAKLKKKQAKLLAKKRKEKEREEKIIARNQIIEKAFHQWLLGYSLRKLEEIYGLSRCTFSIHFRDKYGENYRQTPRLKGTIHIIREYLQDKSLRRKDREEIKEFLDRNFDSLFEVDFANRSNNIYTDKEMFQVTYAQVNHGRNDYRDLFEMVEVVGEKVG